MSHYQNLGSLTDHRGFKLLDNKNLIDQVENARATTLGIRQHYENNYEYYHPWAEHIYKSIIDKDENISLRSIARIIGIISEQDQNFIDLIHNGGIEMDTYAEVKIKELIGLIALSNGYD